MSIVQTIATILLVVYIIGTLAASIPVMLFAFVRPRDEKITLTVDVLARIVLVLRVGLFWPLDIPHYLS